MTIELRRVTAEDWQDWRSVRLAALREAPRAFGSRLADWADAAEERWRARLSLPGALDLLAVDVAGPSVPGAEVAGAAVSGAAAPRVVGMASGVPDPDDASVVELISMWVDPDARGRGVARSLIDAIVDRAAAAGAFAVRLAVMPDNAVARRAYERAGFVALDEPGDALPDGRHEVLMERDLAPERTLLAYERGADDYAARTEHRRSGLVDDLLGLVPPGSSVLELGSGPGRDADALEAAGLRVDRTDGARSFVDRLRSAGHDARVLDVRHDPFGGPYDAVFANAVLLHVPRAELTRVLRRSLDAVRPGGVLAATVKQGAGSGWTDRKLEDPRHVTLWGADELAALVQQSGWHDVVVRDTTTPTSADRWLTVTARRPAAAA